jgi:thiol-disulfide isomerase/thioredoxin
MLRTINSRLMRVIPGISPSIRCVVVAGCLVFAMIESRGVEGSGKAGLADTPSGPSSVLIPEMSQQIAPALAINDIDEKPITLAEYKGKVVLLDFWAVNCGGCKLEIPWYVQLDRNIIGKAFV